jgi:LPS sulfotransferase NodH
MKPASYVICTSPRSGSTLMCRMLAATGVAGNPESLFYRPSLDDWMSRLNVYPGAALERERLEIIIQAAIQKGRGQTPVFGLRQQRPSFEFLCQKLAILHPGAATDLGRIERTFGPTQFIHLTRPDKLEQAVSFLKAQQTGLWHVATDGSEWERTAKPQTPVYDVDKIKECVGILEGYDRGWNEWFSREGIEPIRISYNDLSDAPVATLRLVLECLGLNPQAADGIEPEVRRMADATSRDWIARFRTEMTNR